MPRAKRPAAPQARARALLIDALARNLLLRTDVAERLRVTRSTVSRFLYGTLSFSDPKPAALEALLGDVASGRVVMDRSLQRAQIALAVRTIASQDEAILSSLPAPLRAQVDAIAALPGDEPVASRVERALAALAMHRSYGNMTDARRVLGASRRRLTSVWAALERSRGAASIPNRRKGD